MDTAIENIHGLTWRNVAVTFIQQAQIHQLNSANTLLLNATEELCIVPVATVTIQTEMQDIVRAVAS